MSKAIHEKITDAILAKMKEGIVPWERPWNAGVGAPFNLKSKKFYRGMNIWILSLAGYSSPAWLSFKQVSELKGKVKKGEKGTPVVFWKILKKKEVNDAGEMEEKKIFLLRYYNVFNVEQCEGLEKYLPKSEEKGLDFSPIKECEKIVKGYKCAPKIKHEGNSACYIPALDTVKMPAKKSFKSEELYYNVLFHELAHSTGSEKRLKREGIVKFDRFGSERYSKEELIAEFGASFLCGTAGIENKTIDNSVAYLQNWMQKFKEDSTLLITAAGAAQKAADHILGTEFQNEEE